MEAGCTLEEDKHLLMKHKHQVKSLHCCQGKGSDLTLSNDRRLLLLPRSFPGTESRIQDSEVTLRNVPTVCLNLPLILTRQ